MAIKERRTKILLSLMLLSDTNFTYVSFDHTLEKAFDLAFNQKTNGTISGLIREKLIEKEEMGANSHNYKLTEQGFYTLCLIFPFFRFLRDTWDAKWRVLSYEIPEKKREIRDKLRREVSGWGLGPWHRSFWITPHPIIQNLRQLINQKEEEKYIQAFESMHVLGDPGILIEKVWQKTKLENKYRELFKIWHDILSLPSQNPGDNGSKTVKFAKVVSEYVEVLKFDPGLPKDLLGSNWIGFEAFNIFKEIRSILLS